MRTIICGGRDYELTEDDFKWLHTLLYSLPITRVISGGALGADQGGERFAKRNKIALTVIRANWHLHGRMAGPLRNEEMAKVADAVIAFPGGKGTADMIRRATKRGLKLIIR